MKSVATFVSEKFPVPEGLETTPVRGQALADAMVASLRAISPDLVLTGPLSEGDLGWATRILLGERKWHIFLNQEFFDDRILWAVRLTPQGLGFLGLFAREAADSEYEEAIGILSHVFQKLQCLEVRWWDEEDLAGAIDDSFSKN